MWCWLPPKHMGGNRRGGCCHTKGTPGLTQHKVEPTPHRPPPSTIPALHPASILPAVNPHTHTHQHRASLKTDRSRKLARRGQTLQARSRADTSKQTQAGRSDSEPFIMRAINTEWWTSLSSRPASSSTSIMSVSLDIHKTVWGVD